MTYSACEEAYGECVMVLGQDRPPQDPMKGRKERKSQNARVKEEDKSKLTEN